MGRRVSGGSLIVAVLVAVALAGCSTSLDDPTSLVGQLFQKDTGKPASSVSCPSGIPIAKGHQFSCTVQAQGASYTVTLLETTATAGGEGVEIVSVN